MIIATTIVPKTANPVVIGKSLTGFKRVKIPKMIKDVQVNVFVIV